MQKLKQLIARNFESFTYFYRHLRYRVFIATGISVFVGLMDGFGLSMFLPLLQMVSDSGEASAEGMGKMRFLVDFISDMGLSPTLISILGMMIVFFTLKGLAKYCNEYYRAHLRHYFISKMRVALLNALTQMRYKYYVTSDVGRIQNTLSAEIERAMRSFESYFKTVEYFILVVVYMGFAFFVDAQFALLVSVGGGLTNFLYKVLNKRTKKASAKFSRDSHGYQGQIIQFIAHFKYLKATGLLNAYAYKLRKNVKVIERSRKKMGVINAIMLSAREPLLIIIVASVIFIQTRLLGAPLGPILVSLLFFYRALTSLMQLQNRWNVFLQVSGSLENTQDFQKSLKANEEKDEGASFQTLQTGIQLKNAYFSYEKDYVLSDIHLTVPKNKTVAFVGESGSGKTTLVNILAALMPLDKGEMWIDDELIKNLKRETYQQRVGYITQDPVIFNDTVFNNVSFWDESTEENQKRFEEALKKAAIYQFVQSMAEGQKTLLGNNGVNLSGGQKQRISIARELYKDIDILIMDEATSALDTETEKSIQNSIEALKGQYTILIVAHRLSTIRNADQIVMMKQGKVDSVGAYTQMIQQNSGFKKMVELQKL